MSSRYVWPLAQRPERYHDGPATVDACSVHRPAGGRQRRCCGQPVDSIGYHGILGIDGEAFGSAVALFILAMFLATVIPAARASRLDPVENLRDA